MKNIWCKITFLILLISSVFTFKLKAGEPCCHIMPCCKGCNKGMTFLVNGEWNPAHDYGDINQVRDIFFKIKNAGINSVIVDMTNPSQWTYLWSQFQPIMNNIQQVCREKNMKFFILIGALLPQSVMVECNIPLNTDAYKFWNEQAGKIWNLWAQDTTYKKFGYGDNRPMVVAFLPSQSYWTDYNKRPDSLKTYLSKFYIGTAQVNDPITPGETDGWGYRKTTQNSSGTIRYTSPNGGVGPSSWFKLSANQFRNEVQWVSQAEKYSIYGSYDDACDAILWGMANTSASTISAYNKYPNNDPFVYYSIIKKIVNPKALTVAPAFLYSVAGDQVVTLDWADNVETDFGNKYKVYRSTKAGGPYSFLAETTVSNFTDSSVVNKTTYFYVVTALNNNSIETGYSNETSANPTGLDGYAYKFDFNKSGNLEGWSGNTDVGGLIQKTSLNGLDGVLSSKNNVTNIDPRISYSGTLALPPAYKSWSAIEVRVRQLDSKGVPQAFDPAGTIGYFCYPTNQVLGIGEIKEPVWTIVKDTGEWIVARADISILTTKTPTCAFVDPIGHTGVGKNFELDYIYLLGDLINNNTGIDNPTGSFGSHLSLQNYPNPFCSFTTIEFEIFQPGNVKLEIYNVTGQKQVELINEYKPAGSYSIKWNGLNSQNSLVPDGIYICKMIASNHFETIRMLKIKM